MGSLLELSAPFHAHKKRPFAKNVLVRLCKPAFLNGLLTIHWSIIMWQSLGSQFFGSSKRRRKARNKKLRLGLEELEPRVVPSMPTPDHVVVVIEENSAYSGIIGSSAAPYINSLAQQGALMTNSFAITHPSQPNYLDLFSGSNQNVTDDTVPPPGSPYSTLNLASELIGASLTFGGYSEDLPSVGLTGSSSGDYVRKHNPWVDFSNVPSSVNMPFAGFFPTDFTKLPTISFVVPNIVHDMHA